VHSYHFMQEAAHNTVLRRFLISYSWLKDTSKLVGGVLKRLVLAGWQDFCGVVRVVDAFLGRDPLRNAFAVDNL
jgi:hypothetical protein